MGGDTTSVSSTVVLPAQPTSGNVDYVPLGGNGYTAPFAAYQVRSHSVTGAVGGGNALLQIEMDPRFCSLISYMTGQINQGTAADADFRFNVGGLKVPSQVRSGLSVATVSGVSSTTIAEQWDLTPIVLPGGNPPPGATPPRLNQLFLNVDGDVYFQDALIYLFNIDVRELFPMGPLLFARGST